MGIGAFREFSVAAGKVISKEVLMKRASCVLWTVVVIQGLAFGKGLQLKDLPPAVQKTIHDTLNGGEIKHL